MFDIGNRKIYEIKKLQKTQEEAKDQTSSINKANISPIKLNSESSSAHNNPSLVL